MLNIALFGAPGAGKGTQAKKIVDKYGLKHLSTGDMIRKEIADGSEFGKMASEIINRGELLSDKFVVDMIANCISNNKNAKGFLFDGFPRTWAQAEMLDQMLEKNGEKLNGLLSIDVPYDELKRRMLERAKIEGRADDTEDVIANRFKEYENKTVKVAQYYDSKGKCHKVDGNKSVDDVFNALCKLIDQL